METVDLNVRFSLTVEDLAAQVARNADRQFLADFILELDHAAADYGWTVHLVTTLVDSLLREGEHVDALTQVRGLLDSLKDS